MKTLQITGPGEFEIMNVPVPEPGNGEVLMRIEAVTTCPQWDLHIRHNDPMFVGHQFHYPYTPGQPGHEAVGEIAKVGPGVTGVKEGDRVSAWKDAGHDNPGCYAQYVVHKEENVIKVPEEMDAEALAPLELAMCLGSSFLLLKNMDVIAGVRFGVMGLGPAGLIAVQMARAEGAAEVLGFDLLSSRRQLALSLGADRVYDSREELVDIITVRPENPEIETAIDCVGKKKSVEYIMDRTSDTLALFGVQRENYTYGPRHSGLSLCGYKGHYREAAEYALGLIKKDQLHLKPLVTHNLTLEEYNKGIALLEERDAVKICFWPWE